MTRRPGVLTDEKRQEYQKGTFEDWILEGNKPAREKVYVDKGEKLPIDGKPVTLPDAYMREGGGITDGQQVKSDVRLTQFLNDTFTK